jgi:DNA-binding NtrC family response regulator
MAEPGGDRPAVLIADDEEAICFALAREVRRRGLDPVVAADGTRAVALAAAGGRLAAAVLDVRMPRLDGVSAALAVRRARPGIPLALMTAFGDGRPPPALGPGVRLFRKPFDLAEFSTWLAAVVPAPAGTAPGRAGAA